MALSAMGALFCQTEGVAHFGEILARAGPRQVGAGDWESVDVARGPRAPPLFLSTLLAPTRGLGLRTPWGPGRPVRVGLWEAGREALVPGPVGFWGARKVRMLQQLGAEGELTSQAPGRRLAELGRVLSRPTRPLQGAQQPLAAFVQRPLELLALQQAHRGYHVGQRHLAGVAGSYVGRVLG